MEALSATICTPAFNNPATMQRTFEMVQRLRGSKEWLVLDQHYSPEARVWLREAQEEFGFTLFDEGRNLGLHDGFNFLLQHVRTTHVVGLDPDTFPVTMHFDLELLKHAADPRNVWVSCYNTHSFSEMREPRVEGQLLVPQHPVVNSICLWSVAWLRKVGGVQEPTKLYGGLECCMWKYLDQQSARWVFALNSLEACSNLFPSLQDEAYRAFKWAHAHLGDPRSWDEFRTSFEAAPPA